MKCQRCGEPLPAGADSKFCEECTREMTDRRSRRLAKLKALAQHPWYGRLVRKLSEYEFDEVVGYIEDWGDLEDGQFATAVMLGNPQWATRKHEPIMAELLLACKNTKEEAA